VDFSFFYFANHTGEVAEDRYSLLLDGARFADEHGFRAVWTPERHFHPFGGNYPNPAVTGAAVAAVTKRVQVRAGSVVSPLHNPLRIAEEWSVVDNISGGRAGISLASGWHATDFCLNPDNYADRRAVVLDNAATIRRLWNGEKVSVVDGAGKTAEVRIFPRPVQSEIPMWITSGGDVETFRNAGRIRAGLLTHLLGQEIDQLADKLGEYRKAASERDDGWPGHVVLMVHAFLGDDNEAIRDLVREPLTSYLRSSLGLLLGSHTKGARKLDPAKLRDKDIEFLVKRSFNRYFDDGGLLGGLDKAQRVVTRLRDIGVDEIACLVDFGVAEDEVRTGFKYLNQLREWCEEEL
jgi:natural product biosynthesis luciferase-like monooxygenase protein